MTEAEWLAYTDPLPLLEFLGDKASDRKLRLFGCACVSRVRHLLMDERYRLEIAASEDLADHPASPGKLRRIFREASSFARRAETADDAALSLLDPSALRCAFSSAYNAAIHAGGGVSYRVRGGHYPKKVGWHGIVMNSQASHTEERARQADLVRDIFGNPFRPLPPRPEAIAPLAEQIYAGAWDLMALLGEWLQEHGYWSEGEHCLDPNNHHVKGCWVVDWVTGRE